MIEATRKGCSYIQLPAAQKFQTKFDIQQMKKIEFLNLTRRFFVLSFVC